MVEIKITLTDDNQVQLIAPLENKILCLGMLDIAHGIVLTHKPEESRIVKPVLSFRGNGH